MKKGKKNPEKKFEREILHNKLYAKPGVHELVIILDHLKRGYNIGKIFRTAEIFSIHSIHIIGTKNFDPYPAKGALKRVPIKFYDSLAESIKFLQAENYKIFAFDIHTEECLHQVEFPNKSAIILGHEEFGPNLEQIELPNIHKVKIKQYGMTESLNVSIAASLGVYEYLRQQGFS